jgi:hypothetical protein
MVLNKYVTTRCGIDVSAASTAEADNSFWLGCKLLETLMGRGSHGVEQRSVRRYKGHDSQPWA